jgi:hypothetical protein
MFLQKGGDIAVLTVEALKGVLNESGEIRKELESQRRKDVHASFKTAPFEDLVTKAAARVSIINYEDYQLFGVKLRGKIEFPYV